MGLLYFRILANCRLMLAKTRIIKSIGTPTWEVLFSTQALNKPHVQSTRKIIYSGLFTCRSIRREMIYSISMYKNTFHQNTHERLLITKLIGREMMTAGDHLPARIWVNFRHGILTLPGSIYVRYIYVLTNVNRRIFLYETARR